MPVNFQLYTPQATDLLTPAMNMVKLKQDQEQMGLLRDYRTMQMQQMQGEQQKAEQQAKKQAFDQWFEMYKIDRGAAKALAKANPLTFSAFQGQINEEDLYSDNFMDDMAEATKKSHKADQIIRDPRERQVVKSTLFNELVSKYGGQDRYKEGLTQFQKGIPSEEQVVKEEAGDIAQTLMQLPEEARTQYEPEQKALLMGKSSELYKQMYPVGEKYAPELKKFVKGKQVRDVDMNKPEDVVKARVEGFTEYVEPEKGRETAGEAAAKVAAKTEAGLKAWKRTFKEMMGREPSKDEIRRKLINDPYGLLEPEPDTEPTPIPKEQHKVGTVYVDKQGRKAKYLGKGQWQPIQ